MTCITPDCDNPFSLFIKDRRFEIEINPFLGRDYKLVGTMWEMVGLLQSRSEKV